MFAPYQIETPLVSSFLPEEVVFFNVDAVTKECFHLEPFFLKKVLGLQKSLRRIASRGVEKYRWTIIKSALIARRIVFFLEGTAALVKRNQLRLGSPFLLTFLLKKIF